MKRKAFSMIELMVAVSVLAIGIVLIARSFLSASNALTNAESRIVSLGFLEGKMGEAEEEALKGNDKLGDIQDAVVIDYRTFIYRTYMDKIKTGEKEKEYINKIMLTASWKEGSKTYDEILATYIDVTKEE